MDPSPRQRLTRQVTRRLRLAAAGRGAFRGGAGVLAISVLWLLAARLCALGPDLPAAPGVLLAAAAGLILAGAGWMAARRPTAGAAARLMDRRTDGKDLFLTAAAIADSPGEYQPVVLAQADARAGTVRAAAVAPLQPWRPLAQLAAGAGVLALAAFALPGLDPLGLGQQRRQLTRQRQRLDETRRATQERAKALAQPPPDEAKVQEAVAKLEETFRLAQPAMQKENQQRLADEQRELGALWKQVNDAQLKSALQASRVEQAFGTASPQEAEHWKEALRRGDVSALQREMQDLARQADALAARPDSAERRAEQARLQQKAGAMSDAASKALQSPGLSAALAHAQDQLAQGRNGALAAEAMRAAGESLKLSQQELDALARSLQNMKNLDDALKAAQLAKQANAQGKLDGQGTGPGKSMADYARLYAAKLGQGGEPGQAGPGMGPNGRPGAGGHARENGGAQTAYRPEKSPTNLTSGQIDTKMSTDEPAEAGEVRRDDPGAQARNAQRVSEAITAEQVPPGYHAAIQKYFDTAPAAAGAGK